MKDNKLVIVLFVALLLQTAYILFVDSSPDLSKIRKVNFEEKTFPFVSVEQKNPISFSAPACNIEIKSTLFSEKGNSAVLFFKGENRKVQSGQQILPGVQIASITTQGVTLHHQEIYEYIQLPLDKKKNIKPGYLGLASDGFPNPDPIKGLTLKKIAKPYQSKIRVVSDNVLSVNRDVFNDVLSSQDELKSIGLAVSSKGGFQATKVKEDSLFSSLGLETGDIIKSINNRDLKSISDVVSMYGDIDDMDALELRFERQGQEVFYFYNLVD